MALKSICGIIVTSMWHTSRRDATALLMHTVAGVFMLIPNWQCGVLLLLLTGHNRLLLLPRPVLKLRPVPR